jgi:outer membrane protein OmpA-like peptidoglycan-associated protein
MARAHRMKVLAGGMGKGMFFVSYSPSSSMSNYAYFTTTEPVTFEHFDGKGAMMDGASVLAYSWCQLTVWPGPAFVGLELFHAKMSGWGFSTPNISVDNGFTQIEYGDGLPLGFPDAALEFDIPPSPEHLDTRVKIAARDDSFVVILQGDVLFDFDKSVIKPEAEKPLTQAASAIRNALRRNARVLIDGFTDNVGTEPYNRDLSLKRAQAAAQWFTAHGYLPSSLMVPNGFGSLRPVAPNTDAAGRAKNRRVEIYIVNN